MTEIQSMDFGENIDNQFDTQDNENINHKHNYHSKKNLSYYASDIVGTYIVNPITGAKYPWKVGTLDENRFFKVIDNSNNVSFRSSEYGHRVSHKLYYETPTDYMKHRNIVLDQTVIENWKNKMQERGYKII